MPMLIFLSILFHNFQQEREKVPGDRRPPADPRRARVQEARLGGRQVRGVPSGRITWLMGSYDDNDDDDDDNDDGIDDDYDFYDDQFKVKRLWGFRRQWFYKHWWHWWWWLWWLVMITWFQDTEVMGDKDDSRCLLVTIHRPSSSSSSSNPLTRPFPILSSKFIFDDHIRCMAARCVTRA